MCSSDLISPSVHLKLGDISACWSFHGISCFNVVILVSDSIAGRVSAAPIRGLMVNMPIIMCRATTLERPSFEGVLALLLLLKSRRDNIPCRAARGLVKDVDDAAYSENRNKRVLVPSIIMARFVLTGSQQFGLLSGIMQSLAGRIGMNTLLPLSYAEIPTAQSKDLPD